MLSIIVPLMVIVWIAMVGLSLKFPAFALPITWATFAFEQVLQSYNTAFLTQSWLWNVITAAAVMSIFLINYVVNYGNRARIPSAYYWTILLLLLTLYSIVWSPDFDTGLLRVTREGPQWIVCVLAPLCLSRNKHLEYAIIGMIVMGCLVLLGNYYGGFGARGLVLERVNGRLVEGNPLAMASFANIVGVSALFSIYRKSWPIWLRVGCLLVVALSVFIAIRTGSRGQVIGFFLISFLWSPVLAKKILKVNPIPALIIISLFLWAGSFFLESVTKEAGWGDRYSSQRLNEAVLERYIMVNKLFDEYIAAGMLHWLVGLGNSASFTLLGTYPHVTIAEVLCEEGILGLILTLGIIGALFRQGFALMNNPKVDQGLKVSAVTILAAFTFEIAISFKEGSLLGASNLFSFGLLLAVMKNNAEYETTHLIASEPDSFYVPDPLKIPNASPARSSANGVV
jgi:hypothetical protein